MSTSSRPATVFGLRATSRHDWTRHGRSCHPASRSNWYDQSELVTASARSVRDAILIGALLAALVLLVFLRSWRVTLIALLVVPASLSATIVLLYALGMSFNIMTLGGMAAAVGLIIDDAIVMIEQIIRRVRQAGIAGSGVLAAAAEFGKPLAGSSAATVVVFFAAGVPQLCDRG